MWMTLMMKMTFVLANESSEFLNLQTDMYGHHA